MRRTLWIEDDLYEAAKSAADASGDGIGAWIRGAMEQRLENPEYAQLLEHAKALGVATEHKLPVVPKSNLPRGWDEMSAEAQAAWRRSQ